MRDVFVVNVISVRFWIVQSRVLTFAGKSAVRMASFELIQSFGALMNVLGQSLDSLASNMIEGSHCRLLQSQRRGRMFIRCLLGT